MRNTQYYHTGTETPMSRKSANVGIGARVKGQGRTHGGLHLELTGYGTSTHAASNYSGLVPQVSLKDKEFNQTKFSEDLTIGAKSQTAFSKWGINKNSLYLIDKDLSFDNHNFNNYMRSNDIP